MPTSVQLYPESGQIVDVRKRPFVVLDVQSSATPAGDRGNPQHLITLSSLEDDALGDELQVIWELEPGAITREKSSLPTVDGFDSPRRLDAFLDAVLWGAVSSADDRALQSPFRSGVEVEEYQLDPVVRALSMPRVNLLIADDVGLGKTIEAGLVVQELLLRYRARTVLVVCPSSIQIQWRDEMRDKFGLEFRIVDSEMMADLRRKRGLHVNPWTHFPRLITSVDFLKRERPLRLFRETAPTVSYPRPYDLLIVDEAHNVAPSGRGKYATDSQRTLAVRTLAPHFEHKLFLSATPHNGYRESFTALLELLDNQRFARGVPPNRTQLDAVMVRRLKSELKRRWDGSQRFAERLVLPLEVPYSEPERQAHRDLRRYTELRQNNAASDRERFAAEFVLKLLKKRLFSSPAAFASTLEKHAKSVGLASADYGRRQLERQFALTEEEYSDDQAYEQATDDALESASRVTSGLNAEEKELLNKLRSYAHAAATQPDSKAKALLDWLNTTLKPDGQWDRERVILFTEYRTTQKWLHDTLASHGFAGGDRLMMMYGGLPQDEREKVKAAFQADPGESPVRILLATDAASEGLNLQNHCSRLIHYEIPWNPSRMEQRNGRVDRHGQRAAEVRIYHPVGKGFEAASPTQAPGELEGDLEFLMRAALKVESIREDLGKVGPVIAEQVEEAMLGQRRRLDLDRAEREAEPVRRMLRFERKLKEQLERLADQLQETRRDLRLNPANVENVVQTALAVADQPALVPTQIPGRERGTKTEAWFLPALTGAWRECHDGLLHPHTGAIRPITFDHSVAEGRDDVVLAHLNHRLVQMCLRLLRAEVWATGSRGHLHRVTARLASDGALAQPVLIAHGRLVVLGADNHRLHEEIILAGGTIREGRFSRLNVGETKAAYDAATDEAAPGFIEERLQALWPKLAAGAQQALDARMADRTRNLQSFLDERCEREVANLTTVLEELARNIREELEVEADPQLLLEFNDAERSQRQLDLDNLRSRLARIPDEIQAETGHLRRRYRDPQPRLFPVALTFILPRRAVSEMQRGLH